MKKTTRWIGTTLAIFLVAATTVSGDPVAITGYDVEQTPGSGFGCWSHSYAGTITNTGRTVSGSGVCSPEGTQIFDYSGGSGTLNDGQFSFSPLGTHLFTTRNADDGQPIRPVIRLRLGGTFRVTKISLFGGDIGGNALPGAISGATVAIGGTAVVLASIPFGTPNAIGVPANDLLDLTGTPLANIPTNEIVLSDFTSSFFGSPFDQFAITEIIVDAAVCNGKPATIICQEGTLCRGTAGHDVIVGTEGNDTIFSFGGDDTICGLGGDDLINAGDGDNWVDGGSGNDRIYGGRGDDDLYGGDGNDLLSGQGGNDNLWGGPGRDQLYGGAGDDYLNGDPFDGEEDLLNCGSHAAADTADIGVDGNERLFGCEIILQQ